MDDFIPDPAEPFVMTQLHTGTVAELAEWEETYQLPKAARLKKDWLISSVFRHLQSLDQIPKSDLKPGNIRYFRQTIKGLRDEIWERLKGVTAYGTGVMTKRNLSRLVINMQTREFNYDLLIALLVEHDATGWELNGRFHIMSFQRIWENAPETMRVAAVGADIVPMGFPPVFKREPTPEEWPPIQMSSDGSEEEPGDMVMSEPESPESEPLGDVFKRERESAESEPLGQRDLAQICEENSASRSSRDTIKEEPVSDDDDALMLNKSLKLSRSPSSVFNNTNMPSRLAKDRESVIQKHQKKTSTPSDSSPTTSKDRPNRKSVPRNPSASKVSRSMSPASSARKSVVRKKQKAHAPMVSSPLALPQTATTRAQSKKRSAPQDSTRAKRQKTSGLNGASDHEDNSDHEKTTNEDAKKMDPKDFIRTFGYDREDEVLLYCAKDMTLKFPLSIFQDKSLFIATEAAKPHAGPIVLSCKDTNYEDVARLLQYVQLGAANFDGVTSLSEFCAFIDLIHHFKVAGACAYISGIVSEFLKKKPEALTPETLIKLVEVGNNCNFDMCSVGYFAARFAANVCLTGSKVFDETRKVMTALEGLVGLVQGAMKAKPPRIEKFFRNGKISWTDPFLGDDHVFYAASR